MAIQGGLRFDVPEEIESWTGLTVVVAIPKGHVNAPAASAQVGWFLADNAILLLPVVVFGLLWLLWWFKGRDLGERAAIVVRYQPPDGMCPLEVGTVIDERVDARDVTASIIDLAVRLRRGSHIGPGRHWSRVETRPGRGKE